MFKKPGSEPGAFLKILRARTTLERGAKNSEVIQVRDYLVLGMLETFTSRNSRQGGVVVSGGSSFDSFDFRSCSR